MRKGHLYQICQLGFASAALALLVSGCGGGGGSAAGGGSNPLATGVEVLGALTTSRAASISRADDLDAPPPPPISSGNQGDDSLDQPPPPPFSEGGSSQLNPDYPDRYQVPSAYSVALTKFELLKSQDDPTPYVVFNTGSTNSPKVVDLASGRSAELGTNPSYPTAGTYRYVRMTMVYTDMTVAADMKDGAGLSQHKIRLYTSDSGKFKAGDLLAYKNSKWNWFGDDGDGDIYVPTTSQRPNGRANHSGVVQDFHFSKSSSEPYTEVVSLTTPFTVPENPTGKYVLTTNFDVTQSPLVSGSKGVFVWDAASSSSDDDLDFPPAVPWASGTSSSSDDVPPDPPFWSALPPAVTTSMIAR